MKNFIKLSIFTSTLALAFGLFSLVPVASDYLEGGIFSPEVAFAIAGGGEDGGCCGGGGGSSSGPGGDHYEPFVNTDPPRCDFLKANGQSNNLVLANGGEDVTLFWGTTDATSVSLNNGVGSVAVDGSKSVFVDSDTTFILSVNGTYGNTSCQVSVEVEEVEEPAKCEYLKIDGQTHLSLPDGGKNVTLTWDTTNADSVSINNGVGSVGDDGSKTVFVGDDATFVLTAVGTAGNDTCTATVDVDEEETEYPQCDYFRVDDDDVEEGDRVELEWGTTNADKVYINNGIGYVSDDGTEDVRVYDDITYTLTVTNGNEEDKCEVRIRVDEEEESNTPRCDLEISDKHVNAGDIVTLEWDTDYAEEITIEDNHGEEIFNSKKSKYFDGEIDVRVYEDTEFTLTVEGEDRDRDCEVDVEVDDEEITIYQYRDIEFTKIPYTGFEAGPTLAALFYSLLVFWALFVAYVLVIKRGSILGLRLSEAQAVSVAGASDDIKKKVQSLLNQHNNQSW